MSIQLHTYIYRQKPVTYSVNAIPFDLLGAPVTLIPPHWLEPLERGKALVDYNIPRPHSLYSMVDESSNVLETGQTRKKLTIQLFFIFSSHCCRSRGKNYFIFSFLWHEPTSIFHFLFFSFRQARNTLVGIPNFLDFIAFNSHLLRQVGSCGVTSSIFQYYQATIISETILVQTSYIVWVLLGYFKA